MIIESNGSARNVAVGIDHGSLSSLTPEQHDIVVTLLARVGENAYRRGFQQGVTIAENRPADLRADLHAWRYGYDADDAPCADSPELKISSDRLFTEHPELRQLGLSVSMADAIMPHSRRDENFEARR